MKNNYLLAVAFLCFFAFDSSAIVTKNNNSKYNLKAETTRSSFETGLTLLVPTSNPTVSSTSICEGENLTLTANFSEPVIAPYTFQWTGPNGFISTDENPAIANITTAASGTYTLTIYDGLNVIDTKNTPAVTVNAKVTPTFTSTLPIICKGATPPVLPKTSTNGIKGTWNPPTVDNTQTADYQFIPDTGECAISVPFRIYVLDNLIPIFTITSPICEGDTAPILPTISNNGVIGSWSPAIVSNTTSNTYRFTPTPNIGQCAEAIEVPITVNPIVTPTFTIPSSICIDDPAPVLPTTSNNGITGTWTPATVTTTPSGDYNYTFTPNNPAQCPDQSLPPITIRVKPYVTPTFDPIPPICEGDPAPILPSTSIEGIAGTWSPATISNTTSGNYTFTAAATECANPAPPIAVTVNQKIIPTFSQIPPVCYNSSVITTLPTTSINGITGTWDKAVSNTTSEDYTFTPNTIFCATTAKMRIDVNIITPVFDPIAPICQGAPAPILPITSKNGITGSWNATINTSIPGTVSYSFTPDPEQCAIDTSLPITVNPTEATFDQILPICNGDILVLPTVSKNGVEGVWSPAANNTLTTDYIFTPKPGQCTPVTATVPMTIVVNQKILPTFTTPDPLCSGEASPVLPLTSNNGITGTWNPAIVSNTNSGVYSFTPATGQCALPTTLNVTVNQSPTDIIFNTSDVANDKPEGTITITSVTSGVAPFEYSINNSSFTTNTTYSNLLPGNYTITVKDSNGCEFSTVATINSICFYPNGISPNNDDFNDTFNLAGCNVDKLILYNRYGKEVNRYNNYSDQWGGTNDKGEHLPDGTYFYVVEIKGGTTKTGWIYVTR